MQVLLEVSIDEMFWDFTPLISFLVAVVMTDFWCVLLRGTRLRISGPGKSSKPLLSCFRKTATLLPLPPSQDEQNGPRSDAKSQLSQMLTKVFLAVAQQLLGHIFSRIVSSHFAKLDHLATTILATTNWFRDSSKNLLFSFQC